MFNPEMKVIGFNVADVITASVDTCPLNSEAPSKGVNLWDLTK